MICDICGNILEEGTQICPVCGRQFFKEQPEPEKVQNLTSDDADPTVTEQDSEDEGTTVLTGGNDLDADEQKTVFLDPGEKIFDTDKPAGNMQGGVPPMGMPNGMPQPGMPNGTPMMGRPGGAPNGMPPMGAPQKPAPAGKPPKAKQKKKMGTGKKVALIVIPLVILIAAGIAAVIFVPKFLNYNKAQEELERGDIEDAMELFTELGSFKDSETMVNGGAYYEYAASLMDQRDYGQAAEYFRKAAESQYEDAAEKAQECYYHYAESLLDQGQFEAAMDAFAQADTYSDAKDRIKECYYDQGVDYMQNGDYESAVTCFTNAEGYQDADDMIKQCYYSQAEAYAAEGEYLDAYDYFILSEYSDYESRADECIYHYAVSCYDNADYETALEYFEQVDAAYKDCSKDIDNCYISMARKCENDEDYQGAVEYYELVKGSDVGASIRKNKAAYIESHFESSDSLTMEYLCDLKYANYGTALEDYQKLCGWTVGSFVNHAEDDFDNLSDSIDLGSTAYVHTIFLNEQDEEAVMNLKAYVVYSDGTKSNEISFESVKSNYGTWVSIEPDAGIAGEAVLYVYNTDSGILVEKYTFTLTK